MADKDHDTTVIKTSSSGAGWFIAGAIAIIALVAGYIFLGDGTSDNLDVDVNVQAPAGGDSGSSN